MCLLGYCLLLLLKEKTENSRKKLRKKLRTQGKNSKTQGKNSRFRQIHLVELPKTGPISKPALLTRLLLHCSQHRQTISFKRIMHDSVQLIIRQQRGMGSIFRRRLVCAWYTWYTHMCMFQSQCEAKTIIIQRKYFPNVF